MVDPYDLVFEDKNVTLLDSNLKDFQWLRAGEVRDAVAVEPLGEYLRFMLYQADDVFPEIPN